jgi:8-oxo-dGTP pyrophosphatase MutT (NUDIX family)
MSPPPPVLVKRKLVCENGRFAVFFDELAYQGQTSAPDYLVVAPKQVRENLVTGVAVLPICEDRTGLIKIYRHAIQGESWEIPRGFVEKGETAPVSALRELEEETGLSCDQNQLESLGFVTPDTGILAARIHLFAAKGCVQSSAFVPGEIGHQEFRLFDKKAIKNMISNSMIQDPCTLIGYHTYFQQQP